jgi:sulfate adenylyltransferase subunit 1 (EFTu-like GTPase family)
MAGVKDILFDVNDDIIIENGDFKVSESDQMHIQDIFTVDKGQFKQYPLIGASIGKLRNSTSDRQSIIQALKLQLKSDDYKILNLNINSSFVIEVNAVRLK